MRKALSLLLAFMLLNAWLQGALRKPSDLIVQPEAGRQALVERLRGARQRILVTMYRLSDREIVQELLRARDRGLLVRVLLDRNADNEGAFEQLREGGVEVSWGNPEYPVTHQKSLLLDGDAWILTHNFSPRAFEENRGFALRVSDPTLVSEMEKVMLADWERKPIRTRHSRLLWSPGNARRGTLALLEKARRQVEVENEHMSDPEVERALLDAVQRGVRVRLLMSGDEGDRNEPARRRLREGGVEVRLLSRPFIHAKLLLVDASSGSLGSLNYSPSSLDRNRELSVILADKKTVASLRQVFDEDWQQGVPQAGHAAQR